MIELDSGNVTLLGWKPLQVTLYEILTFEQSLPSTEMVPVADPRST